MRRATSPTEIAEDLSEQYRRDQWAFATPRYDVYNGHDLRLDRPVQLRFFTPRVLREPMEAARVIGAAREAAALVHPNLVAIYDIGTIGGRRCVVTEATALRLLDRPGPLARDDGMALAHDCVEGLRVAHDAGLVHGDVTAETIAFGPEGTAKLADVGLAPPGTAPEADFRALASVLRQRGAGEAADWVIAQAPATQLIATAALAEPAPATTTIPTRPEPSPEPPPPVPPAPTTAMEAPAKPLKASRSLPALPGARVLAPYLVTIVLVLALLVVAFNDSNPDVPGLPDHSGHRHTGLPPQIPQ